MSMDIYIVGVTYNVVTGETERPEGCDDLLPVERVYTQLKVVVAQSSLVAGMVVREALVRMSLETEVLSIETLTVEELFERRNIFHERVEDPSVADLRDALVLARKWMREDPTTPPGVEEVERDKERVDWIMRKWGVEEGETLDHEHEDLSGHNPGLGKHSPHPPASSYPGILSGRNFDAEADAAEAETCCCEEPDKPGMIHRVFWPCIKEAKMNNGTDTMTLDEVRALAAERKVPGPDVEEHAEGHDGECYCRTCLEYMVGS